MIGLMLGVGLFIQPALPSPIVAQEIPQPKQFTVVKSQYELEQEEERKRIKEEQSWNHGSLTAYYNGKDRMNGETGITSSGYDLDNGSLYNGLHILASDERIPFGTLIDFKVGDKLMHGIVLDRGGRIVGNHFDIVLNSRGECFDFGRQKIKWKIVGRKSV